MQIKICRVCNRYMGPLKGQEEVVMCRWCMKMGYYFDGNTIRYTHVDDTPLAGKIKREMEEQNAQVSTDEKQGLQ